MPNGLYSTKLITKSYIKLVVVNESWIIKET